MVDTIRPERVLVDPTYRWRHEQTGRCDVWWAGHRQTAIGLAEGLSDPGLLSAEQVAELLFGEPHHFGLIVQIEDTVIAATDGVRSYPLFYAHTAEGAVVGNSAGLVRERLGQPELDEVSLLEASMAGYVTGPYTLYDGLRQMEAGEVLVARADGKAERAFHYRHLRQAAQAESRDQKLQRLDNVTGNAFRRLMEFADGRPIWVPLSGGRDSRLIVCKLLEGGYDNIQTFSYGPRGNWDARIARDVAARLGLPWRFVPTGRREARRFYGSPDRRAYWSYADGHCSLPSSQDLLPVMKLRSDGAMPDDAVLVNGQTGDFLTGGHVPASLMGDEPNSEMLVEAIVAKHLSLWKSLKTETNLQRVTGRIRDKLGLPGAESAEVLGRDRAIALYQAWEQSERQAKFVVNGQRIYDFLDLRWRLPLWDGEFSAFWRDMPPDDLYQQRLYRDYLESWNFRGLFVGERPVWAWSPAMTAVILPLSWTTRLLLGRPRRDRLFDYLKYFDRFATHYACFPYRHFARHAHDLRQAGSLYVESWLVEQGLGRHFKET